MKIKLSLLFVTGLLFYSCCPYRVTKYDKEAWGEEIRMEYEFPPREIPKITVVNIEELNFQATIFPKEYTMTRDKDIRNNFTPTIEDIKTAEVILKEKDKKHDISQDYNAYYNKRQYMGYYSKEGEKILLINFLRIKTGCQEKSLNAYLFDKYFLDLFHPDENEMRRLIVLP